MKKKDFMIILALCALVGSSMGSITNSIGSYYMYAAQKLSVPLASISVYGSIINIVSSFVAIFLTKLLNKNNIKAMMLIFSLCCGICVGLLSVANSLISFYVLAALIGVFMSLMGNTNINILINSNIKKNVGSVSSFIYIFAGLFGTICSSLYNYLIINKSLAFAYITNGALVILLSIPTLFVKFDYQLSEESETENIKVNKAMIGLYFVVCVLCNVVIQIPSYFTTVSLEKGYDVSFGTTLLSMSMLGNILAKLFTGKMNDKLGVVKAMFILKIVSLLDYLAIIFVSNKAILICCAIISGIDFSITAFMLTLLAKELFKYNYHTIFAIGALIANIGYSILINLIVSTYDKYHTSVYILLSSVLCSFITIVLTYYLNKHKVSLSQSNKVLN